MAKQISSIQFKGKLGENVGFTGLRGQAFVRKANTSIKNPRTTGQNVQRMILATVGTSIGFLSEVLNSSVQGKSRGAETLAYLRGEWMRQLRVQNIFDASNTLRYATKGYNGFTPNPYLLSKGTIYGPATTMSQQYLALNSDDLTAPDAAKTATQLFPTIALGDQITLICCYKESGAAPYYGEQPISCAYLRFAFKDDSVPALITGEDSLLRLNPAAIDLSKAAGAWRSVIVRNDGTGVGAFDMTRISRGDIVAGALLVSNLEGNKRSTSYLSVDPNANLFWTASFAEPTFGNNSTPLDFASEIYLNNSAAIDEDAAPATNMVLVTPTDANPDILRQESVAFEVSGVDQFPESIKVMIYGDYGLTDELAGSVDGQVVLKDGATSILTLSAQPTWSRAEGTIKFTLQNSAVNIDVSVQFVRIVVGGYSYDLPLQNE